VFDVTPHKPVLVVQHHGTVSMRPPCSRCDFNIAVRGDRESDMTLSEVYSLFAGTTILFDRDTCECLGEWASGVINLLPEVATPVFLSKVSSSAVSCHECREAAGDLSCLTRSLERSMRGHESAIPNGIS